jgi:serine/threonine protein kinase/tetratricopeptide (TPR) repeat protein
MSPLHRDRWQEIDPLLDELLDAPPATRAARLEDIKAEDPELAEELEQLLRAEENSLAMFDSPVEPPTIGGGVARPDDRRLGSTVAGYTLVRQLGEGGMGTVYLAEKPAEDFRHRVAVKLLKTDGPGDALMERFRDEQRILAALNHPNIARFYDGGLTEDRHPYIVMEWIDGTPIDRYCDEHQLDLDARLELVETVCRAVEHAHHNLIVHRDLKPSNILVTDDGTVKLLDFGVAKLLDPDNLDDHEPGTLTSMYGAPMTPEYAAPEQFSGGAITTSVDVWALGVVLYELLTGNKPFDTRARMLHEIAASVLTKEPSRPSTAVRTQIPTGTAQPTTTDRLARFRSTTPQRLSQRLRGDLDTIVLTALRKEPERRYGSVEQLREDISRHRRHLPINARTESRLYVASRFFRRNWGRVAVGAAVLTLLVGALAVALTERQQARREAVIAERVSDFLVELFRTSDPKYGGEGSITARDLLEEGARRIDSDLRSEPELRARMLMVIGESFIAVGDYDRALQLIDEAEHAWRETSGDHGDETLAARSNRAYIAALRGDLDGAEAIYEELLHHVEGNDTRPDVAATITNDYGLLLVERGTPDAAIGLYEAALEHHRRGGNLGSQAAIRTRNNLAMAYRLLGRNEEAEEGLRQVLSMQREMYDEPHPDIANTINNLAAARRRLGDLEGAEQLYRNALEQRRAIYGDIHPDVAQSINNIGSILYYRDDLDGTADHFEQAYEIWREYYGGDHPRVADGMTNLGSLRRRQGRHDEAIVLHRQAAEMQARLQGTDSHLYGLALVRLGGSLAGAGRWEEARASLEDGRECLINALGEDHPRTVAATIALAEAHAALGRPGAARALLESTLTAVSDDAEQADQVQQAIDELASDA